MTSPVKDVAPCWWERLAMLAFPRRFRRTFGADLLGVSRSMYRSAYGGSELRRAADLIVSGLRTRAEAFFGRRTAARPRIPDRSPRPVSAIAQDLAFAFRIFRRNPGFTLVAVLSLAIGLGANTAIFSLFDSLLFRPLPVHAPEELALLHWTTDGWDGLEISISGWVNRNDAGRSESSSFAYPFLEALEESDALHHAFGFARLPSLNLRLGDESRLGDGHLISRAYFDALGIAPWRGRLLESEDFRDGAEPAVLLTHAYWRSRFNSDEALIGTELSVNGVIAVVVGVLPPGFVGVGQAGFEPDVFVPLVLQSRISDRGDHRGRPDRFWLHVLGRRAPGVTPAQLEAALQPVFAQSVRSALPELADAAVPRLEVRPGRYGMTEEREDLRFAGMLLGAAAGMVLLIACVNLANLLMARGQARRRELAVRRSLGAGGLRVVQQLLTESVLLALLGGLFGLLVARWLQAALVAEANASGLELRAALDARAMLFALGASLLAGLLCGLGPALHVARRELQSTLQSASAGGRTAARLPFSRVLLTVQVALSLIVLVAAALFVRTIQNLYRADTGYSADSVVLFNVDPTLNRYGEADARRLLEGIERELRRLPGVVEVGYSDLVPAGGTISTEGVVTEGSATGEEGPQSTILNAISPSFLDTYQVPLLSGRGLTAEDRSGSAPVVVVNEAFARRHFPGGDVLGRSVVLSDEPVEREIVGVSGDFAYVSPRFGIRPAVHVPIAQLASTSGAVTYAVRHRGPVEELSSGIRTAVRRVDAGLPVFAVRTQRAQLDMALVRERVFAAFSGGLGFGALLLACVGLYGLLSYSVLRRTHEIGIRMALGAHIAHILRLVLRELQPVAIGLVLGLIGSWFATRALESLLFGLDPMDPIAVVTAVGTLLAVAAIAGWVPARRAARVEPVEALRTE